MWKYAPVNRAVRLFLWIAIIILWGTAIAKLSTVLSHAPVIWKRDAVVGIKNEYVLAMAGVIELAIVLYSLISNNTPRRLLVINFFALNILAYHILRALSGFQGYGCPCLGAVPRYLPFSEHVWDRILFCAALFLFLGSTIFLAVLMRKSGDEWETEDGKPSSSVR